MAGITGRRIWQVSAATLFAGLLYVMPAWGADILRVGIAAQLLAFNGPLRAGEEQGIFQRNGLELERIEFGGGAKLHAGIVAGAADVALAGGTDFSFVVKGAPERVVASIMNAPANTGVIVSNPAIHALDDLKGRHIGVTTVGGYTYWLATELARVHGWGPQGVIPVPIGGATAGYVSALQTGQVDAAIGEVAIGLTLEQRGIGRLLGTAADFAPDVPSNIILAHSDLMQNRPEVLRRFLAAWLASLHWLLQHRDAAIRIGTEITGLQADVMARDFDLQLPGWSQDGRLSQRQLEATAQALVDSGLATTKLDLRQYYNDAFLPP